MKRKRHFIVFLTIIIISLLVAVPSAMAVGTIAGTEISNKATATYTVGTVAGLKKDSNLITLKVDELINITVTWQDVSAIVVAPGDIHRMLVFKVTNTGNAHEIVALTFLSALTGDQFDPTIDRVYLDTSGNGQYDAGIDVQYQQGINNPDIAADGYMTVFVFNDIPLNRHDGATNLQEGDTGDSQLTATSMTIINGIIPGIPGVTPGTGGQIPGTGYTNKGEGGTTAVVGTSRGEDTVKGTYVISSALVNVNKTYVITDPFGTHNPVPGAIITFSIIVDVTGTGTAKDVIIEDTIPANTTYKNYSLLLNSVVKTDAINDDEGEASGNPVNKVIFKLGNMINGDTRTMAFQVTIN